MIIIGHRGARGLAPENTLASIKKAIACQVDEVEVDVRVTKDGVPILHHDRFISSDGTVISIASLTYAAIQKAKPDIATLGEALKLVAHRTALLIEVKHGEPTQPVIQVIRDYSSLSREVPRILLGSKSHRVLTDLHRALPEIPKVVIEPWSGIWAAYRANRVDTRRISMRSWWLWTGFLAAMARRGFQIVPYTINNPQKLSKWQPYVYGIVTDYPDRFMHMLTRDK